MSKHITTTISKKTGQQYINYISPIGVAHFPKLIEPDEYEGVKKWKTGLIMSADAADAFIAELQPLLDAFVQETIEAEPNVAKRKKLEAFEVKEIMKDELDESGEPTGNVILQVSRNVETKKGRNDPPSFFDSFNKPLTLDSLWGGSRIRCAGYVMLYCMKGTKSFGASVKLDAVQVIELRDKSSGGGGGSAFGVVEGGFGGSSADTSRPTAPQSGSAPDEDDEEF